MARQTRVHQTRNMAYDGQGNLASKNGTGYTFDYGNRLNRPGF
ncbi:hypothetical protein [Thermomonas sp.]